MPSSWLRQSANRPLSCIRRAAGRIIYLLVALLCAAPGLAEQSVRIKIANNVVLVPVRVNDRDLSFLLDTGSDHSAIDDARAQQLGLAEGGSIEILKDYRKQAAATAEIDSLAIGKQIFRREVLTVVNLDSVSQALGSAVDGVLGTDILKGLTFKVDYAKQELVFGLLQELGNVGTPIQLRRSGNEFFVPLRLMSIPTELLLDTGTNSTNLSWGTWQKLSEQWEPNTIVDGIVRAGFPTPPAFLVCLPKVAIGDTAISDQVVRVQRQVSSGAFAQDGFGGILGSEFLRQFLVTFDLEHNSIFLKKIPEFKRDPYRYTTIGIQFAREAAGNDYVVMGVWKNSPADESGIKPGDRIKAVNTVPVASFNSEQLSGELHRKEGTPISLTIQRDSISSVFTLRTRKMLCGPETASESLHAAKH